MPLATFVAKRLLVVDDATSSVGPPGSGKAWMRRQPDDTVVSLVSKGDAFDIFIGKKTIYNLTLTPKVAVGMSWWILHWWIFDQWFGFKLVLWSWAMGKIVEETRAQKTP